MRNTAPNTSDNGIYYFIGNITSHTLHALPLYKKLGGTFVVLSNRAKKEMASYNVPVININNTPYRLMCFGYKIKPVYQYTVLNGTIKETVDFLNRNAKVVIFYELFDFPCNLRLTSPKTIYLTHGYMLKDYLSSANHLEVLKQYDFTSALGPYFKKRFIDHYRIPAKKLIDIGIARLDEVIKKRGQVIIPKNLTESGIINPAKKVISYIPTFWGASSIYSLGLDIIRHFPNDYTLLFRPHPQTPEKILRKYRRIINASDRDIIYAPNNRFPKLGLVDIFNASSVIIGDVSSVMLEAVLVDKPLIFAYGDGNNRQSADNYASISDIVRYSESITVGNVNDLKNILEESIKRGIDAKIWDVTKKQDFYDYDGSSSQHIANFIKRLATETETP